LLGTPKSHVVREALALYGEQMGHRIALPTMVRYEWLRGPRTSAEVDAQEALFPAEQAVPFGAREAAVAAQLHRLWTLNRGDFEDVRG
jgi:predicted nucleic acid-binding protein